LMQRNFYAHRYPQLIINLIAGMGTYAAGALWFFFTREPVGIELRGRVARYFVQTD
jgi:hypothetical protein